MSDNVVTLDDLVGRVVISPPCQCGGWLAVIEQTKRRKLMARCRGCGRFVQALDHADVFQLVGELRAFRRWRHASGGGGAAA
jgi:hypothetical protein